jgi:hypothetical protein
VAEKSGMKKKNPFGTTLIVAGLVLLVAAYAYFFEYKKANEDKQLAEQNAKVIGVEEEKLAKIELIRQSGPLVLEKDGELWKLTQPVQDSTDAADVESYLRALSNEKIVETVVEGNEAKNLSTYGLDKPITRLKLEGENGFKREIKIGSVKSFDGQLYAQINDEQKVLLVNSAWESHLSKLVKEFRNKKLMRKTRLEFDRLKISGPSREALEFAKKEQNWVMLAGGDLTAPINNNQVSAFAEQLKSIQAEDFVAENKQAEKNKFGKPVLVLEASNTGEEPFRIEINSSNLATSSDSEILFQLQKEVVKIFEKTAADFYDKHAPFKFDSSKVKALEVTHGSTSLKLKKEQANWTLSESVKDKELDSAKVDDLIDRLNVLEADRFLGKTNPKGVVEGKNQIVLKNEKGEKLVQINWGALFTEKGDNDSQNKFYYVKSDLSAQALLLRDYKIDEMPMAALLKDKK